MKMWLLLPGLLSALFAGTVLAGVDPESSSAPAQATAPVHQSGPFVAIVFDESILQDFRYDPDLDRIYLKRQVEHRNEAITLRNSSLQGEAYRLWFNGSHDLVSPANSGHPPNGWTDWVQTSANFVEYWMDGKLILHLKRVRP